MFQSLQYIFSDMHILNGQNSIIYNVISVVCPRLFSMANKQCVWTDLAQYCQDNVRCCTQNCLDSGVNKAYAALVLNNHFKNSAENTVSSFTANRNRRNAFAPTPFLSSLTFQTQKLNTMTAVSRASSKHHIMFIPLKNDWDPFLWLL